MPLEQIQVGRAPGDSEVWTDLLDAETEDVWMRDPPVSSSAPIRMQPNGAAHRSILSVALL